jgi:hypothetical protein
MSATTNKKSHAPADGALAKVFAHHLRVKIWETLMHAVDSPNGLAKKLDQPLGNVAYHVRQLVKYECLELVKTEQRRGATEHYYRGTVRPMIPTGDWAQLSIDERRPTSRFIFQLVLGNVIAADEANTFDSRLDRQLVRLPVDLDEEGWAKVAAAYDDLTELVLATQAESANRLANTSGAPPISAVAALLFFERAPAPES